MNQYDRNNLHIRTRNKYVFTYIFILLLSILAYFTLEWANHIILPLLHYCSIAAVLWTALGFPVLHRIKRISARDNDKLCIWQKQPDYIRQKTYQAYFCCSMLVSFVWMFSVAYSAFSYQVETVLSRGYIFMGVFLISSGLAALTCLFAVIISVNHNTVDNTISELRKNTPESLSEVMIILMKNETSFDKNDFNQFCLGNKIQYMLEEGELQIIFAGRAGFENIPSLINRWCYIISIDKQEELDSFYHKVYEERKINSKNTLLGNSLILNYNPRQIPLETPVEFRNLVFINYLELYHRDEISFLKIWDSTGGKGNEGIRENSTSDFYREEKIIYYFQHPEVFLKRINAKEEFSIDFSGENSWLIDFYKNACIFKNMSRSIMAMLDYMELILKLTAIFYYRKGGSSKEEEQNIIRGSFFSLSKYILKKSTLIPENKEQLGKEYRNSELFQTYLKQLNTFLPHIHFEGEKISFLGVVSLIQILRNKVVAHGVINEDNSPVVWGLLFYSSVILNNYLKVNEFLLQEENGEYLIGYKKDLLLGGKLIIDDKGYPCIAAMTQKNKEGNIIYINYFNGELITPEFISL